MKFGIGALYLPTNFFSAATPNDILVQTLDF